MQRRSFTTARLVFALAAFLALAVGFSGCLPPVSQTPGVPSAAVTSNTPSQTPPGLPTQDATASDTPVFYVFFTDPASPGSSLHAGGLDEALVAAIDAARVSVDIAVYNFTLQNVAESLLRASQRGVPVRLVMETGALDGDVPQWLLYNGIPIVTDQRESLMHNKFIIIDGLEVWTGSMNLTTSGVYSDNNNMVRMRSPAIAADYHAEFEEMFTRQVFSSTGGDATPYPVVDVDGHRVEVYFSPDDGVARHVIDLVSSATTSVDFLSYSFTSDDLAAAMIERSHAGVLVRGIFDETMVQSNEGVEFPALKDAGLDVHLDGNPGLMHHKVIIVDDRAVIFGSYNFTRAAEERNDENLVIVYDRNLARLYREEFERIYARALP